MRLQFHRGQRLLLLPLLLLWLLLWLLWLWQLLSLLQQCPLRALHEVLEAWLHLLPSTGRFCCRLLDLCTKASPPRPAIRPRSWQLGQVMVLKQGGCTLGGSCGRERRRRRSCVQVYIATPHKSQLVQRALQRIFCCQVGVVEQRNQGFVTQRMLIKPLPMGLMHTLFQLSHANLTMRCGQ